MTSRAIGETNAKGAALPVSDRRLRVTIVSHSYVTADRRNKFRELARSADVCLVTPRTFREPPFRRRTAAPSDGSHLVRAFRHLYLNPGFSSTRYLFLSPDLGVRAFRPDVVQVENELHSLPVLQAIACRRFFAPGARLVVSFWQNQTWDDARGRTLAAIQRRVLPSVDFFLPANHDGDQILGEQGIPRARRMVLPPVGVDTSVFAPPADAARNEVRARLGIGPGECAIAYCGRLVPEKGVTDLLAAMGAMRSGAPGARLVVIGTGSLEGEVRERSRAVGLPLSVHATQSTAEVAACLGACDVLVLPSRTTATWKEQYGRVLIEAMACELAVVGSDSGEIPRIIGEAGLTFGEADVGQLATVLSCLCADADQRRRLGVAGRARVLRHYSDAAIAERSLAVYRALCSNEGSLRSSGAEFRASDSATVKPISTRPRSS